MGESVTLVTSSEETAKDLFRALTNLNLLRDESEPPQHEFVATGHPESFERVARRFLGPEVSRVTQAKNFAESFPTASLAVVPERRQEATRTVLNPTETARTHSDESPGRHLPGDSR